MNALQQLLNKSGAIILFASVAAPSMARDYVSVVGSSTVYPFSTVAAENFGRESEYKTPKIESTGSGGGMKLFCAANGPNHPDITNSSRRIKKSEFENCNANGVTGIIETKIGFDGIVMANAVSGTEFELRLRDIFLALAKQIPDPNNAEKMIDNPYKSWENVRSDLPNMAIRVFGPPPTSGTRDAFLEIAMEGGCQSFAWLKALSSTDKKQYKTYCHTIREDGAYVEAGENDNLIVQKLNKDPQAIGIFGFSFLDQNLDKVKGLSIEEIKPEFDAIASGAYPIVRSLYAYVKQSHISSIPSIIPFMLELISPNAAGEDGYLSERGLIPLQEKDRQEMQQRLEKQIIMTADMF